MYVCRITDCNSALPLKLRAILLFMVVTWALSGLPVIAVASSLFLNTSTGVSATTLIISITASIIAWSYLLGFLKTFDIKDGVLRYLVLLYIQLTMLPVFAVMEICGVLSAIISPPFSGFHIVKKEGRALLSQSNSQEPTKTPCDSHDSLVTLATTQSSLSDSSLNTSSHGYSVIPLKNTTIGVSGDFELGRLDINKTVSQISLSDRESDSSEVSNDALLL